MNHDIERILIDEASIATQVEAMAAEISTAYRDVDELILVCILNGAFRFTADLEAHLTVPYNIDFMSLSRLSVGFDHGHRRGARAAGREEQSAR